MDSEQKKIAVVGMPAGLGDMHWVMTKMESFKAKNNIGWLKVVIHEDSCHTNSKQFLELIPFVDEVEVSPKKLPFDFFSPLPPSARRTIKAGENGIDALIEFNTKLELGHRIESILPEYDINYDYHLLEDEEARAYAQGVKEQMNGKLVLLYSSSNGMFKAWTGGTWLPKDWVYLAERIFDAGQCRSVLIGKEWDLNYVEEIMRLDKRNVIHNLTAQTNIMQALALIRAANVFIGFPSGLTILATKFKTPVVMFWSIKNITPNGKFKKEFQTCWVDKRVLDAGTYFPFAYGAPETNYKFVFDKIRRFIV